MTLFSQTEAYYLSDRTLVIVNVLAASSIDLYSLLSALTFFMPGHDGKWLSFMVLPIVDRNRRLIQSPKQKCLQKV